VFVLQENRYVVVDGAPVTKVEVHHAKMTHFDNREGVANQAGYQHVENLTIKSVQMSVSFGPLLLTGYLEQCSPKCRLWLER